MFKFLESAFKITHNPRHFVPANRLSGTRRAKARQSDGSGSAQFEGFGIDTLLELWKVTNRPENHYCDCFYFNALNIFKFILRSVSHQLCVLAYNFSFKVDDVIDVNLRRQCLLYGQLTSETPKTFLTEDCGDLSDILCNFQHRQPLHAPIGQLSQMRVDFPFGK